MPPWLRHPCVQNTCIKAFTVLFSYINFLPIPWRLAILHHSTCTRRDNRVGHDFYGRPTRAVWFLIRLRWRQWIASLLNLAWIFHFFSLAGHLAYPTYREGQTSPGSLVQNVPFVASLLCQIGAVVLQSMEEKRLKKSLPRGEPRPQLTRYLREAWSTWRSGRRRSRLVHPAGGSSQGCLQRQPSFWSTFRTALDEYKMAKVHFRKRHSKHMRVRCTNPTLAWPGSHRDFRREYTRAHTAVPS